MIYLAYNNENICNKKVNMNEIGEKRKITFCSKKRKIIKRKIRQ